jgi:predicted nucleotidyltransferase
MLAAVLPEIERVAKTLNDAGVRYLIVGGVAVVLYGYLRTTADLDLVVQLDAANTGRAVRALDAAGYRPRAPVPLEHFAERGRRAAWVREKGMVVFTVFHPEFLGLEIDLFVEEPFEFEAAWDRAVEVPIRSQSARVVALSDLIALKRASGRALDLADIEALEHLRGRSEDGDRDV